MKICMLANAQSKHILRWAHFFKQRGHEVNIVSARHEKINGIKVYTPRIPFESKYLQKETFDANRTSNFIVYLKYILLGCLVRSYLKKIKPDIVMAMTLQTNGVLSLISGFHPTVYWHLGCEVLSILSEYSLTMRLLVKRMVRTADLFYTMDNSGVQWLVELGCPKDKIRVHPWGIDLNDFPPLPPSSEMRQKYDAVPGPLVLCVRTLEPHHDALTYVKSTSLISKQYPTARFILIGDGVQRDLIRQTVDDLNLSGIFFHVGYIPYEQLSSYFSSADIYVDPVNFPIPEKKRSWWGHTMRCSSAGLGYTVSLFSAMRYECASAVSNRPGLTDIIPPAYRKYLWQPGNHEDLAEKISALISNPKEMAAYGKESREIVTNPQFDWLTNCEKTEAEYLEVISRGQST